MGGSSTQQTSTASSQSPPPQVMANYQGVVNRATTNANTPYTPYPGEQVAPLSNQTLAGLGNMNQYAYAAQPYLQQAGQMTQSAAAPVSPVGWSADEMSKYMNPFTANVVQATQNEYNNQNQQQAEFLNSQNMGAGAFGGDRAGVGQAVLAGQQQTAQAPTIANLNQANWNQALAEFNNQQQTDLAAQQFNRTNLGQMANQYGNIGLGAQQAGITGATNQTQAGMIPQGEQQLIDTATQNQWNQGQAYPFQTTGWLGNIVEGIGSQSGGTSAGTTTAPGPSQVSQDIGLGVSALGALAKFLPSDVRFKENVEPIGKTFDGQTIHKFNYRGDPRTQIGLVAQEVEHRHPGAVYSEGLGGLKYVDYDAATRESERAGFQGGGPAIGGAALGNVGLGKFNPAAAMLMMGDPGAAAGSAPMDAAMMARSPGGTLFGRGQPPVQPMQGGPSPLSPMPAPPLRRDDGGRVGFQTGGGAISGLENTGFVDFSTPYAIGAGAGVPSPTAGVSNLLFSSGSGGGAGGSGTAAAGFGSIGTSSLSASMPNLAGAAPGTTYPYLDYQDPGKNFGTAGAEASLGPLTSQPGLNYDPNSGVNPHFTVNYNAPQLRIPGGTAPGDTAKTENTPAAAAGSGAAAPAAAAATPTARYSGGDQLMYVPPASEGWGSEGRGAWGQNADRMDAILHNASLNGRQGFQDGGLAILNDPRYSHYGPETGNARAAHYYQPTAPPPDATPVAAPAPRHVTHHAAPAARDYPLPPRRPVDAPAQVPFRSGEIPAGYGQHDPQDVDLPDPPAGGPIVRAPPPAPPPIGPPGRGPAQSPLARFSMGQEPAAVEVANRPYLPATVPPEEPYHPNFVLPGGEVAHYQPPLAGDEIGYHPPLATRPGGFGSLGETSLSGPTKPLRLAQPSARLPARPGTIALPGAVRYPMIAPPVPALGHPDFMHPDEHLWQQWHNEGGPDFSGPGPVYWNQEEHPQFEAGGRVGFWAGGGNSGGVMGQMPLAGATGYTPQGWGMTGQDSQGSGMGSFQAANAASGGFGALFDGGSKTQREGFADGGAQDDDDLLEAMYGAPPPPPTGPADIMSPSEAYSRQHQPWLFRPSYGEGDVQAPGQYQTLYDKYHLHEQPPAPPPGAAYPGDAYPGDASNLWNPEEPWAASQRSRKMSGFKGLSPEHFFIPRYQTALRDGGRTGFATGGTSSGVDAASPTDWWRLVNPAPLGLGHTIPTGQAPTAAKQDAQAQSDPAKLGESLGNTIDILKTKLGGSSGGAGDGTVGSMSDAAVMDALSNQDSAIADAPGIISAPSDAGFITDSMLLGLARGGVVRRGFWDGGVAADAGDAAAAASVGGIANSAGAGLGGFGSGIGGEGAVGGEAGGGSQGWGSVSAANGPGTASQGFGSIGGIGVAGVNAPGPSGSGSATGGGGRGGGGGGGVGPGAGGVGVGGGTTGGATGSVGGGGHGGGLDAASQIATQGVRGILGNPFGQATGAVVSPAESSAFGNLSLAQKLAINQRLAQLGQAPLGQPTASNAVTTHEDVLAKLGLGDMSQFGTPTAVRGLTAMGPGFGTPATGPSGLAPGEVATQYGPMSPAQIATLRGTPSPGIAHTSSGSIAPGAPAPAGLGSVAGSSARGGLGRDLVASADIGGRGRAGFAEGGAEESAMDTDFAAAMPPPTAAAAAPAGLGASGKPTREEVFAYNESIAPKYGNDPRVVRSVLQGEMGARDPYEAGDAGSSFGPWQFHKGGLNPKMPHAGMGDDYAAATGHDPADPRYWQEQSDFAQAQIAKGGLTPWATTMNRLGLNRWSARTGDQPSGGAQEVQAHSLPGSLAHADPETQMSAVIEDSARPPDRKLIPDSVADAMMAAGAAMMAGTSPNAMTNIGQGILAGMNYYQKQRQLDREWQKTEAEIQNYGAESRYRDAVTKLETQKLDLEMQKWHWAMGDDGETSAAPPSPSPPLVSLPPPVKPAKPTVTAPAGAQAPATAGPAAQPGAGVGAAPPAPSPITGAPVTPAGGQTAPAGPIAPAGGEKPPGEAPSEEEPVSTIPELGQDQEFIRGNALIAQGEKLSSRGSAVGIQGRGNDLIAQGKAMVESAKSRWGVQTAPMVEQQKELTKTRAAIPEQVKARAQTRERVEKIMSVMANGFQPGAFANEKGDIIGFLRSIGINIPSSAGFNPEALQMVLKENRQLIMAQVRDMGNRPLVSEIKTFEQGNPGPEMQAPAAASMLTEMEGITKWQDQYANDLTKWLKKNPGAYDESEFAQWWIQKHPMQPFIDKEVKDFAYTGQPVPHKGQYVPGQKYRSPKTGKFGRAKDESTIIEE